MEDTYLTIIRKGALTEYWLKAALKASKDGKYSIAELRDALKEGLRRKIQEYAELKERALSLASQYDQLRKEAEDALARLERGEDVEYLDVYIPAK